MTWVEKIISEEPYGEGNELKHFRYTGEEIVRCRDCEYANYDECPMYDKQQPDGFCAWGERENG